MEKLNGKWIGEYTYGEGYDVEKNNLVVSFEMELMFDGDSVKGTCVDDETKELLPGPATLEGTLDNNFISFIKKYPCLIGNDEENKAIAVPDQPSLPIHYTGTLHKKLFTGRYVFEGEWEITSIINNEDGSREYYTGMGYWTMMKA
ncbi:MAG: hypothetical protein WCF67_05640 [Chitinophagaceae bacterium]